MTWELAYPVHGTVPSAILDSQGNYNLFNAKQGEINKAKSILLKAMHSKRILLMHRDAETYILHKHKHASGAMQNFRNFTRATVERYILTQHLQLILASRNAAEPTSSGET